MEPTTQAQDWPELRRVRRAVLVVDVVESVRMMNRNEDDVIHRWRGFVAEVRRETLPRHDGVLKKSLGDGMLIEFHQTARGTAAAFELQRRIAGWNTGRDEDESLRLRIGLHVTDVVEDDLDIYGAGVNLAARLVALAPPGGVVGSADVVDELLPGIDALIRDGGRFYPKHWQGAVQWYHLAAPDEAAGQATASPVQPSAQRTAPASAVFGEAALRTCVALFPIAAVQGDAEQAVLAQLVGDILLTRLSTVQSLKMIARLSTEQYLLRGLDAHQVGVHSGAAYVVAGRLHRHGAQARLFLELIEVQAQSVIWADAFALDAQALLAPEEAVTPPIARALLEQIAIHEMRSVLVSPLPNIASQTLQFSAIHLMHRRARGDFVRAHDMLTHLVDRHPMASAPHAWLAKWHVLRVTKGWAGAESVESDLALSHTRRALDLDGESAMALSMEAFALCHLGHDLEHAKTRLDDALRLNPSEPWAWLVRSAVESLLGHGAAAWTSAARARELSPMDPLKHYFDGLASSAAVAAERWTDAEQLARLSLSKDPSHLPTLRALAIALVHQGRPAEGAEAMAAVLALQPDFTLADYKRNVPRGGEGMRAQWALALREAGAPES